MPLVTTDAQPMNQFHPLRVIPVHETEAVWIADFAPFTAHYMKPEDLAAILLELHGSDLREASHQARAFVEREHSWEHASIAFRELLCP
jgi:hypothetical protein